MTIRACALLPTYDNPETVAAVVAEVRRYLPEVIVVDDGSGPAGRKILDGLEGIHLVRHSTNLGKGAALLSGFARARELGFSHAISLDADGQHRASDLPALHAAAQARPEALVSGCRALAPGAAPDTERAARRRRKSRLLRLNSNFWVWVETGTWVADTQSGFRVYPLQPLARLASRGQRYELEVECVVQLLWERVPVVSVPVHADYGPGSASHFQALPDFLRVTRTNLRLLTLRGALPLPLARLLQRRRGAGPRAVGELLAGLDGRRSLTLGLGLALAWAPLWGIRRRCARSLGKLLGAEHLVEDACLWLALPWTLPLLFWGAWGVGARLDPNLHQVLAWLLGALICGLASGLLGALVAWGAGLGFRLPAATR